MRCCRHRDRHTHTQQSKGARCSSQVLSISDRSNNFRREKESPLSLPFSPLSLSTSLSHPQYKHSNVFLYVQIWCRSFNPPSPPSLTKKTGQVLRTHTHTHTPVLDPLSFSLNFTMRPPFASLRVCTYTHTPHGLWTSWRRQ